MFISRNTVLFQIILSVLIALLMIRNIATINFFSLIPKFSRDKSFLRRSSAAQEQLLSHLRNVGTLPSSPGGFHRFRGPWGDGFSLRNGRFFFPEKGMVKGGCWDIPAFIVGCYVFFVVGGGGFGTILPLTFAVDVWIEWE